MLFSSLTYIIFLTIVVFLYWQSPRQYRIILLFIASYIFYMSWSPPFGLIYGPVIFLDSIYFYALGRAMQRWPNIKKQILIFGIVTELCLLAYFKYANFLANTAEHIMQFAHVPINIVEINVFLPLAISFTNFILISYLVDIYRGDEKADNSFMSFATYVAFFPHLIAGPIVRARELLHQFDSPRFFNIETLIRGIHLFFLGFGIKIFVADLLSPYVDMIYGTPQMQGFDTSWVATYGFAIQIFCDFAGYTLMAQGSALMLGYKLPENFDAPYFSLNISDFWRRWHMTLSRWLKDYIYIPLGGSRCSLIKTYRNLFITMGLGGLWHGANWTFVIWGIYQGLLLSLHKLFAYLKLTSFIPSFLAWAITFHVVCIGWVFFRAQSFSQALELIGTMLNPATAIGLTGSTQGTLETGKPLYNGETAIFIILTFLLLHWFFRTYAKSLKQPLIRDIGIGIAYLFLIYFGITMKTESQQFIYFQF